METLTLPATGIKLSLGEIAPDVSASFNELPLDEHVKSRFQFRLRRYSRGRYTAGTVEWLDPAPFYQTAQHNPYAGGRPRPFHPLRPDTQRWTATWLIPALAAHLPGDRFAIGVHQIRIVANDDNMGKPAPEGVHQDGFDYVAVAAVARTNVNGGVTMLLELAKHDKVLFEDTLAASQVVLFDDRLVAHYTTPITPRYPGTAFRDVFVVTFSECNEEGSLRR